MIYICAWCKGGLPQNNPDGSDRVSHGICPSCIDLHFPDVAAKYREMKESQA